MKYSEAYQRTRDIDWFFRTGNRFIHVASNGGKLPNFVNNVNRLRNEQAAVSLLNNIKDVQVDITDYVNVRTQASVEEVQKNNIMVDINQLRESYLSSFVAMAQKGFYSFDRALNDESKYILVCGPKTPIEVACQLMEVTDEIEFDGEGKDTFHVKTKYKE